VCGIAGEALARAWRNDEHHAGTSSIKTKHKEV
jgi:hypothetical protein